MHDRCLEFTRLKNSSCSTRFTYEAVAVSLSRGGVVGRGVVGHRFFTGIFDFSDL